MVIDELIVRNGTTNMPIDSYDNQMIDEIVLDGNTYHFAKQKDLLGETSVNADNAVNEPLVSLKVSGNSVQSILPTEYQQVEYIESTGTQYIDTGFKPNQNTKVEVKSQYISTTLVSIFGSNPYFVLTTTSGKYRFRYNSATRDTSVSGTELAKLTLDKNKAYLNGGLVGTFTEATFQSPYNALLFARSTESGGVEEKCPAKLYYAKLWDNDVLIRDYIPCYRKSDNVIGLYDLANNVFYTNQGTGTFLKGANAPTPEIPIPIQNAGDNQLLVSNAVTLNNVNIGATKLETYDGSKCLYFAIEGGKKYTISLAKCSRFSACTSGAFPRLRTPIYDRADAGALTPSETPTTLVVNATENLRYLIIRYYNSTTDTYSEQEILDTLSVEVDKPISVNLLGANLFDIDTVLGTMGTIVDSVRLGWTKQADGSWYCFNIGMVHGERIFTNTGRKQGKLTLLVNQKTRTAGTTTGLTYRIMYLDGTMDTLKFLSNTEFQDYSITSNPNKTVDYIDLSYLTNYGTYIKYLMINWGDVMPYEPYRKQSVSLPSSVNVDGQEVDLRFGRIEKTGSGATNGKADYLLIDRLSNKVSYIQNTMQIDISQYTITYRGIAGQQNHNLFATTVPKGFTPNPYYFKGGLGLCNNTKWLYSSAEPSADKTGTRFQNGNGTYLYYFIPINEGITSVALFKEWLANHETIVIYALDTPIEYDLTETEIGQNLLALATEKGANILEIKSEIPVSQTELSYWRQIIPNE